MAPWARWDRWGVVLALAPGACGSSAGSGGAASPACGFVMPNPPSAGLPNPAVYVVNADGTITDRVSGLIWEATVKGMTYAQPDAAVYCASKGAGWHLPTRIELVSLVDYTVGAPGPTINAVFAGTPIGAFWTSTLYAGDLGDAWAVGFDVGYSDYTLGSNPSLYVRCVRTPALTCYPTRYEVQAGGLVTDRTTGLTWEQVNDPTEYSWTDAAAECASKGAGWRVPSLPELQTILDDARTYPAIDQSVFPNTPSDFFWTSSPEASGGTGAEWYVDFYYGATDADVPARQFYVRCVR
jgi:hypothetical protein